VNDDERKRILEGLRVAMMTESDGHSFYKMASLTVQDDKGRETLQALAAEEEKHFQWLKLQRETLVRTGELDADLVVPAPDDVVKSRSVFSDDLRKRLEKAQFEMSVLSIGIQLELNSIKYYSELAENTKLDEAKAFFEKLVAWEKFHYETLCSQYDDLKQDYWAAAGFAPF